MNDHSKPLNPEDFEPTLEEKIRAKKKRETEGREQTEPVKAVTPEDVEVIEPSEKTPKTDTVQRSPQAAEAKEKARLIRAMEADFTKWWNEQVKIYDQETKLGMDTRSVRGAPTRERIAQLVELWTIKDPDFRKAWNAHLEKTRALPDVEKAVKDPEKSPRTVGEYALDGLAGKQSSAFDGFLGARYSGEQAMEALFKRISGDIGVEKEEKEIQESPAY